MNCDRCGCPLEEGEGVPHGGKVLCEDCMMDTLSPAKACDPWAVKAAKGTLASTASSGESELQGIEKALYEAVKARGRLAKEDAPGLLGVTLRELERAFAVLRHMELLRGSRRQDGGVDLVLFK